MKPLALALLLLTTAVAADDLIEVAREAKAKRKKSTTKVITNADVKKSKGKLVETAVPPLPADAAPQQSSAEKHEAAKKSHAERERKLAAAQQNVAALEKALAAIEQKYYDENDLDRRDKVIVKEFAETKAKLDAARQELAAAQPE